MDPVSLMLMTTIRLEEARSALPDAPSSRRPNR
jgi:hypothetical protein